MPHINTARRAALQALGASAAMLLIPSAAWAETRRYRLDPSGSEIGFGYKILGEAFSGAIPVSEADIVIDFTNVARTEARVVLDARQARAGVVLATQGLRGATVLDVDRFPKISFTATRTRSDGADAVMDGDLTVRDVTRPVQLRARFMRPPEADPDARDRLAILLTGSVSRSEFGATGYADLVGDQIDLRIRAEIVALE